MAGESDTRVWTALLERLRGVSRAHVKVGVLSSKGGGEEHGDAADGAPITMTELAAIHEFGSPAANIPERSFIRRALVWNSEAWLPDFIGKLAGAVVTGKMTEEKALAILGTRAVAEVRKTITSTPIPPPLQPATVAAKGSDRPLVDTGRLLGAISFEVLTS